MSTLAVVEEILRETSVPMTVREIVAHAGPRLPSKSKTPDTVVARDLAMNIKRKGADSIFVRTSPGRYTLRALVSIESAGAVRPLVSGPTVVKPAPIGIVAQTPTSVLPMAGALKHDRAPALGAKHDLGSDSASQASRARA